MKITSHLLLGVGTISATLFMTLAMAGVLSPQDIGWGISLVMVGIFSLALGTLGVISHRVQEMRHLRKP